jgi:uncharacterized protein (DUF1330 family)
MTAYIIAEVEVTDPTIADKYRVLARKAVAEHGGRYVVRNEIPVMLEGDWGDGKRLVVLSFDDMNRARDWYNSDAYAKALQYGRVSMIRRIALVPGAADAS